VLIHRLFEQQVERTPDAVALCFEDQLLTYAELNGRANQLARQLRARGIGPEGLVGLCVERSVELVIGLLGVLKSGGAYVPLDPAYPPERLAFMLEDASPAILLTQARLRAVLPEAKAEVLALDDASNGLGSYTRENLQNRDVGLTERNLAYVIYTSGSTGRPKGAMNEHRGVVNRLRWMQSQYRLSSEDRVLQKTPYSFDVSVWEFFWPLMTGARLVIALPGRHRDPPYLWTLIEASGITTLHFVPSMLQAFLNAYRSGQCRSLRHIVCSGEELTASLARRCFELLPWVRLSNLYGPTEAAVDVTAWECDPGDDSTRIPIGRPITNVRLYVLDDRCQPVPAGEVGEIYIGGAAVGRGYLNQPALTAERFIADPFSADPSARLYKTGDLGRWRDDGAIEYLGRNDHQVKINGQRIELGEIEAQLLRDPLVREAIVMAREDVPGDRRLIAYVVLSSPDQTEPIPRLRKALGVQLPEHMIPRGFVVLERFPLTPSGKIDRRALPPPGADAYPTGPYEAPRGKIETALAEIWHDVLRAPLVGRRADFFELGGHSLLAMRVAARVGSQLGVPLAVHAIFAHPTLEKLAAFIEKGRPGPEQLGTLRARQEQIIGTGRLAPLSIQQQSRWDVLQKTGDQVTEHVALALRLRGDLDVPLLRESLEEVIRRHESLRTRIVQVAGEAKQRISARGDTTLSVADIRGPLGAAADETVHEHVLRFFSRRMDLNGGPLFDTTLLRVGEREHVLGVLIHHLIGDGLSASLLFGELSRLYVGLKQRDRRLLGAAAQYADYATWQRDRQSYWLKNDDGYWRDKLAGSRGTHLPPDSGLENVEPFSTARAGLAFGEELSAALVDLSKQLRIYPSLLVLSLYACVLACWGRQHDFLIGTFVSGRCRPEDFEVMGEFSHLVPLRVQMNGDEPFREVLEGISREFLAVEENIESYQQLELLNPRRELIESARFNWLPEESREWAADVTVETFPVRIEIPANTIRFTFMKTSKGIHAGVRYRADLFRHETVRRLADNFRAFAATVVRDPQVSVASLISNHGPER
jgi:amino acid adenylation domain-containing protein